MSETLEPQVAAVTICKLDGSTVSAGYVPTRTIPVEQIVPVITPAEAINSPLPPPAVAPLPPPDAEGGVAAVIEDPNYFPLPELSDEPPPQTILQQPVDELVAAACPWYTPGGSLMGWSKLKCAKLCLRQFFYEYVLGLRVKREPTYANPIEDSPVDTDEPSPVAVRSAKTDAGKISALDLGSLVHACIEAFYRTGDLEAMWAPAEAVKRQYPALALETRRLVNFYLRRFNEDEAQNWDNRAVERESRYYFPARKCAGKRRALCISARHDGIYRQLPVGSSARLPPGKRAAPGEARIAEIKTTATLTYNRLRGFYQDAQLMANLLTYNHGHAVKKDGTVLKQSTAELFGSTDTVTVTWIGKGKTQDINKDIERVDYAIPDTRVLEFAADIEDWYYEELGDRLFSAHYLEPATWRKDWLCKDIHYMSWICPFLSLCEAGCNARWEYQYEQRNPLNRDLLEKPKHLDKGTKGGKKVAAVVEGK